MNIYHKIADQVRTGPLTKLGGAWYAAGAAFAWRRSELRRIGRFYLDCVHRIVTENGHGSHMPLPPQRPWARSMIRHLLSLLSLYIESEMPIELAYSLSLADAQAHELRRLGLTCAQYIRETGGANE